MTAPSADPGAIAKLLQGLSASMSDPNQAATLGLAQGLLAASAPHMMTPVSGGQAISMGLGAAQQYQQAALANAMQRAILPMTQAKTKAIAGGLKQPNSYASRILIDNMLGGQAGVSNDPNVAGPAQYARTLYGFHTVGPNSRGYGPPLPQDVNPMGALPEGTMLSGSAPPPGTPGAAPLGSLNLSLLPGAPAAIAANAANRAGGAASATYPYTAALSYHTRAPGAAGGTLGPPPGPFAPMGAPAPQQPSPAAIAAARQRQVGMMQGLSQAARASGVQAPFNPTPPPSQGTAGPNPSPPGTPASLREIGQTPAGRAHAAAVLRAAGSRPILRLPRQSGGLMSNGMTPAALAAAKSVGNQTGAAVAEASHVSDGARQQIALYDQMGQALSQMGGTGQWRDVSTPLGKLFNYFGFKSFDVTSAAEFTKYRSQLVGAATHAVSPRASTQEMDFLAQSVPNYNLPGNAAQTLVSELRGLSQYRVLKSNALPVYLQTIASQQGGNFKGTALGFDKWWVNNGPSPSAIVIGSVVTHLPPQERGAYVQKLQSTVTGRIMLQQYERARAFEAQYPGIFRGL